MIFDGTKHVIAMHNSPVSACCRCGRAGRNLIWHFDDKTFRRDIHKLRNAAEEIRKFITSIVAPTRPPSTDARLNGDATVITRTTGNVGPNDPITSF
jgi:hypothetical protein